RSAVCEAFREAAEERCCRRGRRLCRILCGGIFSGHRETVFE
ncbi:hypothetical protein ATR1_156c0001, partial [Acetobacter tropicalis]